MHDFGYGRRFSRNEFSRTFTIFYKFALFELSCSVMRLSLFVVILQPVVFPSQIRKGAI